MVESLRPFIIQITSARAYAGLIAGALDAISFRRVLMRRRTGIGRGPEVGQCRHWGRVLPAAGMRGATVVGFELGSNDRLGLQATTAPGRDVARW